MTEASAPATGADALVGVPSRPQSHRGRWAILAIVVAAIVVLAALFALGILHFGSSGSTSPYLTFSGAQSAAQGASGSVAGGPWYPALAISLVSRSALLEPIDNVSGFLTDSNCTYDWPGGEPSNLAIAATPTTAGNGTSAYWILGLKNASNGFLLEIVSDGSASALVTMHGSVCSEVSGDLVPFPGGSVDSPAVVAAANGVGGAAFLREYPNATQLWAAAGGISLGLLGATTPEWYVGYTSCAFPSVAGETGAYFNATVGGLSGEVISNHTGTTGCSLVPSGLTETAPLAGPPAAARKAI